MTTYNDIELSNGIKMPPIVMSTNWMDYPLMKKVVKTGLEVGYRAIDTARDYGNEPIVGKVLEETTKEQGLSRSDIFITTKIGNTQQIKGNIHQQVEISLNNLRTDYIDLLLMHWPYPDYYVKTWHKMEEIFQTGKVRAIGVANYRIRHFEHLFASRIEICPHVVQFEFHPLRTVPDLIDYCEKKNIKIQAYSPLCRLIPPLKDNSIITDLSKKYKKTIAQIILRWHIQQKIVPVFKSVTLSRIAENFQLFDFYLDKEDMDHISSLNQDYKYHLESASCPGF